jgi:integrase
MPRTASGPHLWLRKERRDKRTGRITHNAVWVIIDGKAQQSTECGRTDRAGAERALEHYLNRQHADAAAKSVRDPAQIAVADVLAFYAERVVPSHARPKETLRRIERLIAFFAGKTLAAINGDLCREFDKTRSRAARREDLSVLRAAINFYREEGRCDRVVSVTLPQKSPGRERWLTRSEAAKLIWTAWRFREKQKGRATTRASRKHVARFILVALYTGSRAGAVCSASFTSIEGRAWIDLNRGIFYRRPAGHRETRKRQPPVPLPRRLLAHLRRWQRAGRAFPVEWNGKAVKDCDKAFRNVAHTAGLPDVTPHILRHTAATWQMQLGTDLWQAAGFVGMSAEQLERNYGHHHPEHLKGARDAFDRPPKLRQSNAGTETESLRSNVRRIADIR